jgi:hypothetical protein
MNVEQAILSPATPFVNFDVSASLNENPLSFITTDHGYFGPTPNNPQVTNRAGGVPLANNIVRGGINYKIGWP